MTSVDRVAARRWSGFFRMVCARRGTQIRLVTCEADATQRDPRNIRKKYSSYFRGNAVPQAKTAYLIGDLVASLDAPFGKPWMSGTLALYAAGRFSEYLKSLNLLSCNIAPLRTRAMVRTADIMIQGSLHLFHPSLERFLALDRRPTTAQCIQFKHLVRRLDLDAIVAERRRYRNFLEAAKFWTISHQLRQELASIWGEVENISSWRNESMERATEIAQISNNHFPIDLKIAHLRPHLEAFADDLCHGLETARSAQHTPDYIECEHRCLSEPPGQQLAEHERFICQLCGEPVPSGENEELDWIVAEVLTGEAKPASALESFGDHALNSATGKSS